GGGRGGGGGKGGGGMGGGGGAVPGGRPGRGGADGRLRVVAPVQRRGAQGLDRPPTPRPPADVHRRAAGRGDRRRPDQARRTGAGVRVVDPGPAASLPERAQGDRHQAHPDRRDPD